jgi:hypothetical protein
MALVHQTEAANRRRQEQNSQSFEYLVEDVGHSCYSVHDRALQRMIEQSWSSKRRSI